MKKLARVLVGFFVLFVAATSSAQSKLVMETLAVLTKVGKGEVPSQYIGAGSNQVVFRVKGEDAVIKWVPGGKLVADSIEFGHNTIARALPENVPLLERVGPEFFKQSFIEGTRATEAGVARIQTQELKMLAAGVKAIEPHVLPDGGKASAHKFYDMGNETVGMVDASKHNFILTADGKYMWPDAFYVEKLGGGTMPTRFTANDFAIAESMPLTGIDVAKMFYESGRSYYNSLKTLGTTVVEALPMAAALTVADKIVEAGILSAPQLFGANSVNLRALLGPVVSFPVTVAMVLMSPGEAGTGSDVLKDANGNVIPWEKSPFPYNDPYFMGPIRESVATVSTWQATSSAGGPKQLSVVFLDTEPVDFLAGQALGVTGPGTVTVVPKNLLEAPVNTPLPGGGATFEEVSGAVAGALSFAFSGVTPPKSVEPQSASVLALGQSLVAKSKSEAAALTGSPEAGVNFAQKANAWANQAVGGEIDFLKAQANQAEGASMMLQGLSGGQWSADGTALGASTAGSLPTLSASRASQLRDALLKSGAPLIQQKDSTGKRYYLIKLPMELGGFDVRVPVEG